MKPLPLLPSGERLPSRAADPMYDPAAVSIPGELWAIVPVKPFAEGKSRLGLADSQRSVINRAFLTHVLSVIGAVVPQSRIVVVSRDSAALALAQAVGAGALLEEPEGDLNEALTQAAAHVQAHGADAVLSVSTDLPHLTPADICAMVALSCASNVVLAPDEQENGTNAILMRPMAISYRHGIGSFEAHLTVTADAQLSPVIVRRPGLARDIDTPSAYRELLREKDCVSPIRATSVMTSDANAILRDRSGIAMSARAI
jgi:2-phospho-L-lactate guanylyltransferase